jgi:hypothetical protein
MTLDESIRDLLGAWKNGELTLMEFSAKVAGELRKLPGNARDDVLNELSADADENVKSTAAECRTLLHHETLSKDLDFIRQNSPLRPGVRLELFGGYDFYSSDGKPWWLDGRDCYRATFLHFAPRGEGTIAAGVVEFDEALHVGEYKGRFGVLLTSYSVSSPAWLTPEDTVVVYVAESLPQDVSSYRFDGRASPDPVETHATYRLQASSGDR